MSPEATIAAYRSSMNAAGETITLRRYTGIGNARAVSVEIDVMARVTAYTPAELIGPIQQGDQRLIVLGEDMDTEGFVPFKGDKAVVRGRELNIEAVDGNTRRVQGVLIAYEMQARG